MITSERERDCVVVIPVHNALSQTARCLGSVVRTRSPKTGLILINDASDTTTSQYLRTFAEDTPDCVLLENETNLGFLHSANRGLALGAESAPIIILLNSDTIATPGWLEAFQRVFASDAKIGLATPFSNNAVNLTLPFLPGENFLGLAEDLRAYAQALPESVRYPDITTAIGFCLGIRSSVVAALGVFDEAFSPGYGEDSDYHFRCTSAGFRSVLVGDCFIYHEHHASFGERSQTIAARNRPLFDQRWREQLQRDLDRDSVIQPTETIIQGLRVAPRPERTYDVIFVLPSAALAGGHIVVFEIVNRLVERGMNATVIILTEAEPIGMELLFEPIFMPHRGWRGAIPAARNYVATRYDTVPYVLVATNRLENAAATLLVQGYEPSFPGADRECVVGGYGAFENRIVVSRWLQDQLARDGFSTVQIANGVDTKYFVAGDRDQSGPVAVLTLLRDDPKGGSQQALRVLERLKSVRPTVRIIGVGELASTHPFSELVDESYATASRAMMREIYRKATIFFDSSQVQGFGLMGLEAMSSGVACVLTKTGGVVEYANDHNCQLVQVGDDEAALASLLRLVDDPELRGRLVSAGRATALQFDWNQIVERYQDYFSQLALQPGANSAELLRKRMRALELFYLVEKEGDLARNSASFLFAREFEHAHGPRGASEVFVRWQRPDLERSLKSSHQGELLIQLYRAGTDAYHRASESNRAFAVEELRSENLFEQVVHSLSLGRIS